MEGHGLMIWPDQSKFEGDFKLGKIEGKGTKFFANGNRYIGMWVNDQMHGSGVWYNIKDQTKQQGMWVSGKRSSWLHPAVQTHVTNMHTQTPTARLSLQNSPINIKNARTS